jgi:hypothetical protein
LQRPSGEKAVDLLNTWTWEVHRLLEKVRKLMLLIWMLTLAVALDPFTPILEAHLLRATELPQPLQRLLNSMLPMTLAMKTLTSACQKLFEQTAHQVRATILIPALRGKSRKQRQEPAADKDQQWSTQGKQRVQTLLSKEVHNQKVNQTQKEIFNLVTLSRLRRMLGCLLALCRAHRQSSSRHLLDRPVGRRRPLLEQLLPVIRRNRRRLRHQSFDGTLMKLFVGTARAIDRGHVHLGEVTTQVCLPQPLRP